MYSYFKESINGEEGTYSSYSVVSPTGFTIHDVSTDKRFVSDIVNGFNKYHLSEVNFMEALEDAIV